ncbi:3D domain-containing protein [Bacillus licheniformis]|uniref:3D domain-containing protein n=1 Tax=Bacillus licheniformis TaxID=1402 RepID=UPI000926FB3E|nr:3D domain-containing protein [Bacillus licheniformis]OJT57371.1 hypothetical protein BFP47_11725 [Bacillus licheniformis]OJT69987.1 hypothetical protein BFP46_05165 [Bacillus licheniformis]
MKKNKITTGVLAVGLVVSVGGWTLAHDDVNRLKNETEEQKKDLDNKEAKIANLDDVVKNKDKELKENKKVIVKKESQIENKEKLLKKKNKEIKQLKNKLNKKEQKNFNIEKKGSDVSGYHIGKFEMTSYIAMCQEGCTGITRTGIDIKDRITYEGYRIIATDPNVIPLWSIVKIHTKSGSFTAISLDTGGGIKGKIIDFLVSSENEARINGRQMVDIEIIRRGK